jgi:hypothetical protein
MEIASFNKVKEVMFHSTTFAKYEGVIGKAAQSVRFFTPKPSVQSYLMAIATPHLGSTAMESIAIPGELIPT